MVTLRTDVLVIGGGATGAGVAWDAALRGLGGVLAEREDQAEGTAGACHGPGHRVGCFACATPTSTYGSWCGHWPAAPRRAVRRCCPTTPSWPSIERVTRSPALGCATLARVRRP